MPKEINNLNQSLKDQSAKLHYTETVSAAIVFDDLNNDAEYVELSDVPELMEYSCSEFKGKIPAIADDEAYLLKITYSDNTIVRACGGLGEQDESVPSGSTLWAFYSIHGMLNEPFLYAMILGDAKASDDKTSYIFEENTNIAYFAFYKGNLPDSVPVKLEFIVAPLNEVNNNGSENEEELINYFDSYFITIEKTLEINDEFFKTHKFVTQDMINGIGNAGNLSTNNKTIVGAINELFQDVDNGKQLIASAIDDTTINKDSTFEAMSNKITEMKSNVMNTEQKTSVIESINNLIDILKL